MWKLTLCYGIYSKLPLVCHEELGDMIIKHYCQDFLNDGSSSSNIGIPNSNPYFQPWIMLLLVYYTSGYPWPSGTVKSICFLFFPPEFWGKQNKTKAPKVAIFTEFVLGDCQKKQSRILWNFYFPVSPLANFHQAMIFFSFLQGFFFVSLFFSSSFLEQIQAKNPK
jgi:hypothetical protein